MDPKFNLLTSSIFQNAPARQQAKSLIAELDSATKQAECASYLLEELFLRRCTWWIRLFISIRRRFYPTAQDIASERSLYKVWRK